MMDNPNNNKIIKEKIVNKKSLEKKENKNNLFNNKYTKKENKMINYNYLVVNPKNINE